LLAAAAGLAYERRLRRRGGTLEALALAYPYPYPYP